MNCRSLAVVLVSLLPLALADFMACAPMPNAQNRPQRISIEPTESGYLFTEQGDSVLLYRHEVVEPGRPFARAHYIHPLYSLGGEVLTEDFPEDHPHHHGIFWAWHQVDADGRRIGDGWVQDGVEWTVRRVEILDDRAPPSLRAHVAWTSPRYLDDAGRRVPFIEELTTIQVHPAKGRTRGGGDSQAHFRAIDFTIELRALVDGVRLGGSEDEKGYGGFSPRVRLPADVEFTGREGPVEPRVTAVEAGPWLDISGTFDASGRSGIAILQHPSNPGFPNAWILRREQSMQNVKWPGAAPLLLPRDEPVVLRYRLIVHEGEIDRAILQEEFEAYAAK